MTGEKANRKDSRSGVPSFLCWKIKGGTRIGSNYIGDYDVAVIGAGHAGCEAALAAARLGVKTIIFTLSLDGIANMPCNPSIGGTAKGSSCSGNRRPRR